MEYYDLQEELDAKLTAFADSHECTLMHSAFCSEYYILPLPGNKYYATIGYDLIGVDGGDHYTGEPDQAMIYIDHPNGDYTNHAHPVDDLIDMLAEMFPRTKKDTE